MKSHQSRRRKKLQLLKLVCAVLILTCLVLAIVVVVRSVRDRDVTLEVKTPSEPISGIAFETDGVLPNRWLQEVLKLESGTTLMDVDIYGMKEKLQSFGQVEEASVARAFPETLKISIVERVPVFRIKIAKGDRDVQTHFVCREGTIYEGYGYDLRARAKLPYLLPYTRANGQVEPVIGMAKVNELIDLVLSTEPGFFETWRVVDLSNFSGDSELPGQLIEVRSTVVPEIIFGVDQDLKVQLDRLGVILNYVQSSNEQRVSQINLSLSDSASVQFRE